MIARNDFLSIYGLYLYDEHLFDLFQVPAGVDKDALVDNLVIECAELEILYPDAKFMRLALGSWSKKELPSWTKLWESTQFVYNPIWNKDGKIVEEFEETRGLKTTQTQSGTEAGSLNGKVVDDGKITAERSVAAFNESAYHKAEQNVTDDDNTQTTSQSTNRSASNNITGKDDETTKHKNTRTETGNIGVTTTQKMIQEEREVDKFVFEDYVIADFKRRFCLLVY
jgi:hypothetical protein